VLPLRKEGRIDIDIKEGYQGRITGKLIKEVHQGWKKEDKGRKEGRKEVEGKKWKEVEGMKGGSK
jgi:hypothetical protein